MMKEDENAMKIITEAVKPVIKSIIMKNDQMMAVKITIKEDMQQLITEKKRCETNNDCGRNYDRDYYYNDNYHKRRIK